MACAAVSPSIAPVEIVTSRAAIAPPATPHPVATPAPDAQTPPPLTLTLIETLDLDTLKGRVVVVHFWATWCEPCKRSLPELQALVERHSPSDLVVIAVSVDEELEGVVEFASRHGVKFAVVWDRDKKIAHRLMPASMPTTIVVDKKGAVHATHTGYHEGDDVVVDREVRQLF